MGYVFCPLDFGSKYILFFFMMINLYIYHNNNNNNNKQAVRDVLSN